MSDTGLKVTTGNQLVHLRYLCRSINVINHRLGYEWVATSRLNVSRVSHKVIINTETSVNHLVVNGIIIGKYEEIV